MKQRHRRKGVQRRMREAPTQYDLDCAFYGGQQWPKRDSRRFMIQQRKPLVFNMAHPLPLSIIDRLPGSKGAKLQAALTGADKLRPYQQAIIDAAVMGTGWVQVGLDEFNRIYPEHREP